MKPEELTVVVPTYNNLELLKRTIRSLEHQKPDPKAFQTIIADDCSSDGTKDWLSRYVGPLDLKFISLSTNSGRAAVRNSGAELADRDILLFIDGDMEFADDIVSRHIAHHEGDNKVALGKFHHARELGQFAFARYIESRGANKLQAGADIPGRYFLSGNVSLPRSLFNSVNGFDERFKVHGGEDLDLGLRLKKAGAEIVFDPEIDLTHLHLRKLRAALRNSESYGEHSVPILLEKHPELFNELKLDWVDKGGWLKYLRRMSLKDNIFRAILFYAEQRINHRLPDSLFDYLIYRSYYIGFRQTVLK